MKMPRVQEVSYDLPGIDDGLARSVGNARRLPRCGCSASTSTGSRCHHHVTTSSRTGMPSWRSAVKRRSKSGCKSGVHTGARRRATREGCCASPRVKGRSTDGYLWAAVNSERQLRSAAQRQHAAERVGAEGQRRAQRKEAAERTKQEKAKTELELGQQPTCACPCMIGGAARHAHPLLERLRPQNLLHRWRSVRR